MPSGFPSKAIWPTWRMLPALAGVNTMDWASLKRVLTPFQARDHLISTFFSASNALPSVSTSQMRGERSTSVIAIQPPSGEKTTRGGTITRIRNGQIEMRFFPGG